MKSAYTHKFVFSIILLLLTLGVVAQTPNVVLTSGSGTWRPAPGIRSFYVFTWGGGAGGTGSAGGGGGSFSRSTVFVVNQVSFNNGYSYTVGTGGGPGSDGQDTKFELCWGYRGLANGAAPQRYTNPGIIDTSFLGGRGGNNFATCCDNWGGGGGGSAFSNQVGSNGGNAALFSNGGGGNGTGNGASGGLNGSGGNGGVPGGGGGGNGGSGARGEIRIFTVCDYTPGEIQGGYSTPFPAHMPAGSSFIRNRVSPSGFGLTVIWQDSSASTGRWRSITGATQLDYPFPALSQDTISEDTWYRRVVTNGCNANPASNISNVIPIRVFSQANGRLNGTISGKIVSRNGQTGVPNILIRAQKTISLLGSPQSRIDTVRTDNDGNFILRNLYYGDVVTNDPPSSVTFTVTPIKQGAVFQPASRNSTLLNTNPSTTMPSMMDTTVYIVGGRIEQNCDSCLVGFRGPYGIPGARIATNVQGVIPTFSDSASAATLGRYQLVIGDPGTYTVSPTFLNHQFNPVSRSVSVNADVSNVNFTDTSTRLVWGRLLDGGGRRIGSARLLFEAVYRPSVGAEIITFRREITMGINDSTFALRLPAGFQYRVTVAAFTPAFGTSDIRHVREDSVRNYFTRWAPEPLIDVREANVVRNLVYRRPPVIVFAGIKDSACNTNPLLNPGIVFRTNVRRFFEVYVFEGPPALQQRVPVSLPDTPENALGDYIRIYTDVAKRRTTDLPDTIYCRMRANSGLLPMLDTSILPGAPNTLVEQQFRKVFEFHYIDRYGRKATPLRPATTVVGSFNPPSTFTTASPQKPFMILHAPPGDQSFSFWEKDTSYSTVRSWSVGSGDGKDQFASVSIGPSTSISLGAVSFNVDVIATANYNHVNQITHGTTDELTETVTTKRRIETRKTPSQPFVEGTSGDVYVGNAVNYLLGKSVYVDFKTSTGGCEIEKDERLFLSIDSFVTEFAYAEDHILNVVIPQQQMLLEAATTDTARSRFRNQIAVWQQVIEQNNRNKQTATPLKNHSFSNGVVIQESETITKAGSNTITYDVEIDQQIAFELGLRVGGLGASGGQLITIKESWGNSTTTSRGSETTTGYHLEDDNPGDYFSVNIKRDTVYGTPVFDLVAGVSSCPPEEGAQNRDQPQILSGNMKLENLNPSGPNFIPLSLANRSYVDTDPFRQYLLSADPYSGNGLTITYDGVNLKQEGGVRILMPKDGILNTQIRVEKTNPNDKVLSYSNVEFYLSDDCSGGPVIPNSLSTAKVSLDFLSTCGDITLTSPANGWVRNAASSANMPIIIGGYTLTNVDSITLEYQLDVNNVAKLNLPWITGFSIKQAAITNPTSFTVQWNTAGLADQSYNLRLRLVCRNGDVIYSDISTGVINRRLLRLTGVPSPVSQQYNPQTDEISFTYNKPVNNSNLNSGAVSLIRRSNGAVIPVTVKAVDDKVIVIPTVSLGSTVDSFRVIVKDLIDLYGNGMARPDTSFFKLQLESVIPYNGPNIATVVVSQPSISQSSSGRIEMRFRLRERTRRVTRVFFNLAGTAIHNTDYRLTYDTIRQFQCVNQSCSNTILLPVLNDFSGAPSYVNIDSNQQEVVVFLTPIQQSFNSGSRSVIVTLLPGSTYRTGTDSVTATTNILASVTPVLYVNALATGNGTGLNWQNAFTRLEQAINSNQAGVTQIWVARGTYKPTANNSRDSAFVMRNNLAIYGGFAGTETLLNQRNWRLNPTILSGDIGVQNNIADNSFNIIRNNNNGLNASAILDGFIISAGNANGGTYFANRGGGINNYLSSPTIANCQFLGNNAVEYGGAMFNQGSTAKVINTVFMGNTALYGGGLYNESAATELINCTMSGNAVVATGAAMYTYGTVSPKVTNSIIWGNGSGIQNAGGATPVVTNSIVQGGYTGTGNINANPFFMVQPSIGLGQLGDLRLLYCSPALNTGSNAAVPAGITVDLAGNNRTVFTTVDMGAYEVQNAPGVIIYVDATATGRNDGTSWANAFTNLEAALNHMNLCNLGTALAMHIAKGTYTYPVGKNVQIDNLNAIMLGGYPNGGGASRNANTNPVIIKGDVRVLKNVTMAGISIMKQ